MLKDTVAKPAAAGPSSYDDNHGYDLRDEGWCATCGEYGQSRDIDDSPCCHAPLRPHRAWCVVMLKETPDGRYVHEYHTHADGRPQLLASRIDAAGVCDVLDLLGWVKWSGYYEVSNDGVPADPRELLVRDVKVRIAS